MTTRQYLLVPAASTPEPGALTLLTGTAVFGSGLLLRRRRKRGWRTAENEVFSCEVLLYFAVPQ